MRKILSVFCFLAVLCVLVVQAFAAQTATWTLKASETELKPGDKVTFTVSVTKVDNCTMGGFKFEYDKQVFEYVSGKKLSGVKSFFAGVSTAADNLAGFFMNGSSAVEGEMFSVTMTVRENAAPGTYTFSGIPSLKSGKEQVNCTAKDVTVTVQGTQAETTKPQEPTQPAATQPQLPEAHKPTQPVKDTKPTKPSVSDVMHTKPAPSGDPGQVTLTIPEQTAPEYQDATEPTAPKSAFPMWIVIAVAVVAVGGVAFIIVEIKKTKSME